MSQSSAPAPKAPATPRRGLLISAVLAVIVIAGIAADTTVVRIGSKEDVRQQVFEPDAFGAKEFPIVQQFVESKAVDAQTLGPAVLADKTAAAKKYGTPATVGAVVPVKVSGIAGEGKMGVYMLKVDGLPPEITVRVQTGPAINGTDLRDATGQVTFSQFKNQIEYQNAGSGINRAMKKAVLSGIDNTNLTGKTLEVTGAFTLINPKNWLITPVKVVVK